MNSSTLNFSVRYKPRWRFFDEIKNTGKILELGCGRGVNFHNLQLLSSTAEFYGIDIMSPQEIDPLIQYQKINLDKDNLPFPDNTFDAIIFTHVIEHLRNPLTICSEIHRVLKPGGRIYIETPNWTTMFAPSFGMWREQGHPFNFFDDPTHIKPWSKQGLFGFLGECRLRVERVSTIRVWIRIPLDLVKMALGLLTGNREKVVNGFWNMYGWCIYGIGVKE